MNGLRQIFGIFADYLGQYFKTRLAYRADFLGDLASNLFSELDYGVCGDSAPAELSLVRAVDFCHPVRQRRADLRRGVHGDFRHQLFSDSRTGIAPMIYNIQQYGRYPVDVYNQIIRFVLTYVLPFAFVGVYPAAYFLRKETWYIYAFMTPVVGVSKYRGAGS